MKLAYSLLARKLQSEEDNVDTINIASRRFSFSSPADGAAAGNCLLKGKNYAFHQGWVPFSVAEPFQSISGRMSVAATPGDPNGDGALISAISELNRLFQAKLVRRKRRVCIDRL